MKREIKFRAKETSGKDWCYGIMHNEGINLFPVSVDMETIGQFIGFLDTHKREIYEGDILRSVTHPDIIMVIVQDKNIEQGQCRIENITLLYTVAHVENRNVK